MRRPAALLLLAFVFVGNCGVAAADEAVTSQSQAVGLSLQALSQEDLDQVEEATGYRVGVLVLEVASGSTAAEAGLHRGDVLFTVGDDGVDSPRAVDRALAGEEGDVEILLVRPVLGGDFEPVYVTLRIPEQDPQPPPQAAQAMPEARVTPEALEAAHTAGILSDEEYARKRAELQQAAGGAPVVGGTRKGKTYRHIIGFSFWYPADWRIQEGDGFLQLVPPNPGSSPEGPTEAYLVTGESTASEGIQSAADPRVAEYLDMQVKSLLPTLSRVGSATTIDTANGKGVVLDWQGTNPQGQVVRARAFVNIIRDYGVSLLAIGLGDRLQARDADLRQIFASFGFDQGENDPALIGTWHLLSTYSVTNRSPFVSDADRASAVSESTTTLEFLRDGTWVRTHTSRMIAFGAGITLDTGPETTVHRGHWNAGDGSLYMVWEDESYDDFRYQIRPGSNGRELRLASGEKGQSWQERR